MCEGVVSVCGEGVVNCDRMITNNTSDIGGKLLCSGEHGYIESINRTQAVFQDAPHSTLWYEPTRRLLAPFIKLYPVWQESRRRSTRECANTNVSGTLAGALPITT